VPRHVVTSAAPLLRLASGKLDRKKLRLAYENLGGKA
jgi:hypothetical protein